jgi:hypothetical protein
MANLIMAAFWFLLAAALLGWQWLHPEDGQWTIRGTNISFGWLAVILALYNIARWWSRRSANVNEGAWKTAWSERRHHSVREEPRRETRPDPNFDFGGEPRRPNDGR